MLNKIYQSRTRRYLSKNLLVIVLTLFSVSCVNFSTIRNNNTSFLDGYDPEYQKVCSGRIRLIIDGIDFKGVRYKVPYLRIFLPVALEQMAYIPIRKMTGIQSALQTRMVILQLTSEITQLHKLG